MVHGDGIRPELRCTYPMMNDSRSHTNDASIEQNSAVCLPLEAIDEIKAHFVNTLYGFPVGKRLTFPMVENYVKHAWAKFGLKQVMMHHGFFMFQFDSKTGMEKVMEGGPWRIHDYARALMEVSTDKPLVDSVDIDIPRDDGKGYTTVVERETEETTDKEQSNFQEITAQIPPSVIPISIPGPDVPKSLPKPNIPYPSRLNQEKSRDKASNQMEKIFQIIQDLRFDISFADALLLMPRFAHTIKSLLMNKEKLLELAKIPLNENCLAMLLKKLLEKLGDPDKCRASINLMPLSI
ncbi:reverse transcriptase domain-containing protein [Tanacetum coccineum]